MGTIVAIVLLVLIVVLAIVTVVRSVRIVPQAQAGIVERFGRYHRTLHAGLNLVTPFVDRLRTAHRPARAGGELPAAAGHHQGQPGGRHRHGDLLPGDRPEVGHLRDRQLRGRRRAADGDHAAERGRRHGPGHHPHLAGLHQRRAPQGARRGDRTVGAAGQPGGAQGDRAARVDPGLDGEADAGRPGQAGRDPVGRGRQAGGHPDRRGREAGGRAAGPRRGGGRGGPGGGGRHRRGRPGPRPGAGDRDRLPCDPRGQPRSAPAGLQVPGDAARARPGQRQQDVDRAERARQGAGGHRRLLRQRDRRDGGAAARRRRADGAAGPEANNGSVTRLPI